MEPRELIAHAASLARPFTPSAECSSGNVAAALVTAESTVFTGVCIDTACSLGFCAELAAICGNGEGSPIQCADDRCGK